MSELVLKVEKCHPDAILPERANALDSGLDLFSVEDYSIEPLKRVLIKTGIKIELPSGTEGQVRPKSGRALKEGLTILNTPGTVDEGYGNEVGVIAINLGDNPIHITKGQKVAQLCICPILRPVVVEVDKIKMGERGLGGFGSTGLVKKGEPTNSIPNGEVTKSVSLGIIRGKEILILKHMKCKGLYLLPCGKLEEGESYEEAIVREVKEEVNLNVKIEDLRFISRALRTYDRVEGELTFDEALYIVKYNEAMGEPVNMEPEKHPEMKWVNYKEIIGNTDYSYNTRTVAELASFNH